MKPAAHSVVPTYELPPHCPYCATGVAPLPLPLPPVAGVLGVEAALVAAEAPLVHVLVLAGPVGVSSITSFALTHPLFAVIAAGHATCLKVTAGLSEPPNQSKRQ